MISPKAPVDETIAAVRRFNRFYTNVLGLLREGLLDTPFSLTEARVVFELAQRDETEVTDLRTALRLDAGYVSRLLGGLEADRLVTKDRSTRDGRRQVLRLTTRGRRAFEMLDERATTQVRGLLAPLGDEERRRLLGAMAGVQHILTSSHRLERFTLRPPFPGDYGWVVQRHGAVYAQEHAWDDTFEGLVARIIADYVDGRDPGREAAWVAEVDGERVGCVFCTKREHRVAQLRLLLVEPKARGAGIGQGLVNECIAFARRVGYAEMMLWTNDVLVDARRIYERVGFELVEEERHHSFGHDLVGQNWWLKL